MPSPSSRQPTKKDLQELVARLEQSLTLETEQREAVATELQAAHVIIAELRAELAAAQDAAQTATAAAAAAAATAAATTPGQTAPLVPRPAGVLRNLEMLSGLDHDDYKACQRTVRNLVVMGALDVTQDFRRHSAEDLAKIYRAAREAHPILKQFQNNWLTAELAKQFLQNRRKHAVRRGYIDRSNLKTSARARRPARRLPSVEVE
ncbi:hypothetical protein C8Q76DRAFT_762825 [Earliella scabrosa]|nr:hypothetical protein C8Q76DRAFT_762825 [Earliella scabrosa]